MPEVTLRPMTADEYARFAAQHVVHYAQTLRDRLGLDAEQAKIQSERENAGYLPDGAATPGMHVLSVVDDAGSCVGWLWLGPHPRSPGHGFVYDIAIDEPHRGRGLGRATMQAAQAIARAQGWPELGLTVTGDNLPARRLYESLGFETRSVSMSKPL